MVTLAILTFGLFLLGLIFGSFSLPNPPGWLYSAEAPISTVFSAVGSMGVWFPGGVVLGVIGAVFAARMAGLVIKIARMALSLFTGGGGHAGG